jgi:hypothetical protein
MSRRRSRRRACRFCGEILEDANRESLSWWTHSHPSNCSYRTDRVPALNGVQVGDLWQNTHTRSIDRVVEIRLGGCGTYTDHEPVFVMADVWDPRDAEPVGQLGLFGEQPEVPTPPLAELEQMPHKDPDATPWGYVMPEPMWALVEHADPLTRPGEYPVPWKMERLYGGRVLTRSVLDEWRGDGLRGSDWSDKKGSMYWHAWHVIDPDCQYASTRWEWWQVDPDADAAVDAGPLIIAEPGQMELIAA